MRNSEWSDINTRRSHTSVCVCVCLHHAHTDVWTSKRYSEMSCNSLENSGICVCSRGSYCANRKLASHFSADSETEDCADRILCDRAVTLTKRFTS